MAKFKIGAKEAQLLNDHIDLLGRHNECLLDKENITKELDEAKQKIEELSKELDEAKLKIDVLSDELETRKAETECLKKDLEKIRSGVQEADQADPLKRHRETAKSFKARKAPQFQEVHLPVVEKRKGTDPQPFKVYDKPTKASLYRRVLKKT